MFITLRSESVKVFPEQRLTLSPLEKQKIGGEKREVLTLISLKIGMKNENFWAIFLVLLERVKKRENQKIHKMKNIIFSKIPNFKIHVSEISYLTKFTFQKSHIWQNSHFKNLIFDKIHISKISYLTKFTILKPTCTILHFSDKEMGIWGIYLGGDVGSAFPATTQLEV